MAMFASLNAQEETQIHQCMSTRKLSHAQCETIRMLTGLSSNETATSSPSTSSSSPAPVPEKRSLFRYIFNQAIRMNSILPAISSVLSSSSTATVPAAAPIPVTPAIDISTAFPSSMERVTVPDHLHPLSGVEQATAPVPIPAAAPVADEEFDQESIMSVSTSEAHMSHNANTASALAYYQLSLTLRVTRMLSWRKRSKTPEAPEVAELPHGNMTPVIPSGDLAVDVDVATQAQDEEDELRAFQKQFLTQAQPQSRTVQFVKSGEFVTPSMRSYLFGDEEEVFEYCPSSFEGESKELMPNLTPLQRAIAQAREHGYHLHSRKPLSFDPILPSGTSCVHSPPGLAHMHPKQKYILRSHQVSSSSFFRKEASHRAAVSTRNDHRHLLLGLSRHERSLREPLNGIIMPSMESTRLRIVYAPRKIPIRLWKYTDDRERGPEDWIEIEDRSCTGGLGVFKRDSQLRNEVDLRPLPPPPLPPHRPMSPTPTGRELPLPPVPREETRPSVRATQATAASITITVTPPKEDEKAKPPVAERPIPAPKPAPPARKPVPPVPTQVHFEEKSRPLPTPTLSTTAPVAVAVPLKVNIETDNEKDVKPPRETSSKRPALTRKSAQTSLKPDDSSQASSTSPIEKFRQWAEDRKRRSSRAAAQPQSSPKTQPKPTISRPFYRSQQTSASNSSFHASASPSMGKRQTIGGRPRPPSTIINTITAEEKQSQVTTATASNPNVLGISTRSANNATKSSLVVQRVKDAATKPISINSAPGSGSSGKEAGDSDKENSKLVPTVGKRVSSKPQRPRISTQLDRVTMPGCLDPEVHENHRKTLIEKYYHSRPPSGFRRSAQPGMHVGPTVQISTVTANAQNAEDPSIDFTAGGEARHVENIESNIELHMTCSPPQSPIKEKESGGDISPTTGKPRRALDFFDESVLPVSRSRALRAVKNQAKSLVL